MGSDQQAEGHTSCRCSVKAANPLQSRKAALFQLAAEMPAPVLAELLGITDTNAADWAKLAARDWTGYLADRAGCQSPN
jgi:hypothetical protein